MTRLAQIISVYPEAYTYKPIRHFHQDKSVLSYVIDFNTTSESASKASSSVFTVNTQERKKVFRNRLVELVKVEQTVRQTVKRLLIGVENRRLLSYYRNFEEAKHPIRLWHPKFVLNSVPEIVPARLPQIDITVST